MSLKNFINLFEQKEDPVNLLKVFVRDLGQDSADSDLFSQNLRSLLEDQDFKNLRSPVAERAADFLDHLISTILEKHPLAGETASALCSLCSSQWGVLPTPCAFIGQVEYVTPRATQLDSWTLSLDIPDNELQAHDLDPNKHRVMWKMTWGSEDVVVEAIDYTGYHTRELEKVPDSSTIQVYQNANKLLPRRGLCVLSGGLRYETLCLAPAWVKNGNIRTFLKENPQSNRFTLLLNICEGLVYLHEKKFIHGGLNMGNILVYDKKKAHPTEDSGFALAYGDEKRERTHRESISEQELIYLAPEQFQGLWETDIPKFDKAVDVYALGVLIIEVLTGELPTLIEETVEARDQKLRPVTFMGDVILKLPPSLPDPDYPIWGLARRCLALSPQERPELDEIFLFLHHHCESNSFSRYCAAESSD